MPHKSSLVGGSLTHGQFNRSSGVMLNFCNNETSSKGHVLETSGPPQVGMMQREGRALLDKMRCRDCGTFKFRGTTW